MNLWERVAESARAELRQVVPRQLSFWHLLGGLTIFLLLIEIGSGVLLMIYYRPSADEAYASVRYIMNDVQLGWLIRGIHRWGADLLILSLLIHWGRVLAQRAYYGRMLNWGMGLLLLLLTGAFAFTGILLVWDQSAFWSTDAARRIIQSVPVLGKFMLDLLWGGEELEAEALLRFYVFHVGLLPWFTALILMIHLYLASRQGLYPRSAPASAPKSLLKASRTYADVLLDGLMMVLLVLGMLLTLTVLLTPALGEQTDVLRPISAKTTWYFLPVYGLLKLISGGGGLLAIGLGVIVLFLLPAVDRGMRESRRWIVYVLGLWIILAVLFLGLWGYWQGGLP
jgi:quinol-cytochrome oxidoreductase complex cytochrome b subunit